MIGAVDSEAISIRQAAGLLGWSYLRTFRWLVTMNRELDGRLLVNVRPGAKRPTYTLRKATLKLIAPALFEDLETLPERVRSLESEVEVLRTGQDMCVEAIQNLSAAVAGKADRPGAPRARAPRARPGRAA